MGAKRKSPGVKSSRPPRGRGRRLGRRRGFNPTTTINRRRPESGGGGEVSIDDGSFLGRRSGRGRRRRISAGERRRRSRKRSLGDILRERRRKRKLRKEMKKSGVKQVGKTVKSGGGVSIDDGPMLDKKRKDKRGGRSGRRFAGGGRRFGPGFSCPDPSMHILMADGSQKRAGDLRVGDVISTYHEKDLEKASKKSLVLASGGDEKYSLLRDQLESSYAKAALGEYKVEFVDIVKDVEKIKMTFEGSEIICSLTHKFYVNDSWKEARDMVIGDVVSDKKLVAIEDVEDGDVVHITIEDAHTYICEDLLSHNKRIRNPNRGRRLGGRRRSTVRRGGRRGGGEVRIDDGPRRGGGEVRIDDGPMLAQGSRGGGEVRIDDGGRLRPPMGCPDPSMLILMADGNQKKAGDLVVGDLIKTNHEDTLELGEYKVEYINILENVEKIKFTFDKSEIICSLTHKFYVDNSWKDAKDMVIGDEVSGQKLIAIDTVENGDVVHITVEDAHTYICEGLLSHNKRRRPQTAVQETTRVPVKDPTLGGAPEREVPLDRGVARDRARESVGERRAALRQERAMRREEQSNIKSSLASESGIRASERDFTRKRSQMEGGPSAAAAFRNKYVSTLRY